ncbi:MAG: hypothetical protein ACK559_04920, partial [bacterium]
MATRTTGSAGTRRPRAPRRSAQPGGRFSRITISMRICSCASSIGARSVIARSTRSALRTTCPGFCMM